MIIIHVSTVYVYPTVKLLSFTLIVNYSWPLRPNVSALSPFMNSNGKIPIPTKFDLWILSNDYAITHFTPYKYGPLINIYI